MITGAIIPPRRDGRTLGLRLCGGTSLPASAPLSFNPLFRQGAAVSLLRHRIARASSNGILTVSPSASAKALALGPDLPRGDWRCPGNLGLAAGGNLTLLIVTYTYICFSRGSTEGRPSASAPLECSPTDTFFNAIPRLRCLPYTRLLSTPGLSTSELLRTL